MNRSCIELILCLDLITSSCREEIQPGPSEGWTQLASMPTARSENAAAVVEHMIYVPGGFGGEQTLEAYDTTTDTWKALADLPEPRHHLMSASYAGKVYIFGGARVICIERLPYAGIATYDLLLWRDRFLLGKWNFDGQHAEPTLRV